MKKHLNCFTKVAVSTLVVAILTPTAFALRQSNSYIYTPDGKSVYAPAGYHASAVYYGESFGTDSMKNPQDLFVGNKNQIYIADTGNDRVLILNDQFKMIKEIKSVFSKGNEETLSGPTGVFVDDDGFLYICDRGNSRVIAVDENSNIKRLLLGDGLISVNENIVFKPEKVSVSNDGTAYVVSSDIYQGIIRYNSDDSFSGFYAPNEVEVTAWVTFMNFWKSIFSEDQQDSMEKILPPSYNNIYMNPNEDNLFFTTAANVTQGQEIKAMNPLGVNILRSSSGTDDMIYGDVEPSVVNGEYIYSRFIDVHAKENGMFAGLDAMRCRVFVYDSEATLITVFGDVGNKMNEFDQVSALEMLDDSYLVLDSARGSMTKFEPTQYMKDVEVALDFYREGLYLESTEEWEKVLAQNSNFSIAYRSIGRAYLQEGKIEESMKMLKIGQDQYFYSLALKEFRKEFARDNLLLILLAVIAVSVGLTVIIKKLWRYLSR